MKAWFVSDIHLKKLNERNGNILLRFLSSLRAGQRPATHLFLLGDIFDLWVGEHAYFPELFRPIVDALIDLQKNGIEVFYLEGNHDVYVDRFWQKFGITAFVDDRTLQVGSLKIRVSHGDLINPEDQTYLRYRNLIRQAPVERLAHILPAKKLHQLGIWASRLSRKKSVVRRQINESFLRGLIHQYARNSYENEMFDYFVSGHMHIRDEWALFEGHKTPLSINLGSWYEQPSALWISENTYGWESLA